MIGDNRTAYYHVNLGKFSPIPFNQRVLAMSLAEVSIFVVVLHDMLLAISAGTSQAAFARIIQ